MRPHIINCAVVLGRNSQHLGRRSSHRRALQHQQTVPLVEILRAQRLRMLVEMITWMIMKSMRIFECGDYEEFEEYED